MNSKITALIAVTVATAALVIPMRIQGQLEQGGYHHYKLVDLGTFGGPQSYFVPGSGFEFSGSSVLNSGWTVAGFADTPMPDPFPNFCWSNDCLVGHSFQAGSGGLLTNLGALRGGGSSSPVWITPNGLIAGTSENGETDPLYAGFPEFRAVLWQQDKIMDLGTLPEGGYQSEANGVNSAGQVVGSALNTIPDANSMAVTNWWYFDVPYGYQQRAFLWDKEKGMQDLGTLPGGTDAEALLVNELGQVVGNSYTSSAPSAACSSPGIVVLTTGAFIWDKNNRMRDLGGFGGTCTVVTDLNNEGQIVGQSFRAGDESATAFLWEDGSIHELGGSLGGDYTGAFALNEQGQAVGYAYLPGDSMFHGALWAQVGKLTDLGVIGNDPCSYAAAINAGGQVVGASAPTCDGFGDDSRAFLWNDGGPIVDLNTLIPSGSSLYLQLTYAINDGGEIAGTGVDGSGNEHAFLLIPCDQNHPGIEGCDYSLADPSTAVEVHPALTKKTPAAAASQPKLSPAELMARFRSAQAGRNRRFGTPQAPPQ